MATDKQFLEHLSKQLVLLDEVTFRPMMGEYLMYCRGKLSATICDNRLLVKPLECAKRMLPDAPYELPYAGAKAMLRVDDNADKMFLKELFEALYEELPQPKPKKRISKNLR